MIRVFLIVGGAIVAMAALLAVVTFAVSEARFRDVERPPPFTAEIPSDTASIARGERIARTRGCFGCHGQKLEGKDFSDQWDWVERGIAPNLALVARNHSPAALEAAIRHGIDTDGRATYSMPSYNWVHLTDDEVAELIAFLRSAPVTEIDLPSPRLGWPARWRIAFGGEPTGPELVKQVPPLKHADSEDPAMRRGERLAMTMCNECHGFDLRGAAVAGPPTPDLAMIAGYPLEDFTRLMRECVAMGGRRDLGLMSLVCPDRFYALTNDEIADLHSFLGTLYLEPAPENVPWR